MKILNDIVCNWIELNWILFQSKHTNKWRNKTSKAKKCMQIACIYFTKCWEYKPTKKTKGKAKASRIASYVHLIYTLLQCGGTFKQQRKVQVHKLDFLDVNGNTGVMNHLITTKDLNTFDQPNLKVVVIMK
jgi:hypothetical protein